MNTLTDYSEYSIVISDDPQYYGVTDQRADEIANRLTDMIVDRFPGILVIRESVGGSSHPLRGPDSEVLDEIFDFVSDHWMSVL